MIRTASGLVALAVLAMSGAAPAGAQELAQGTWTGTMTPPGGAAIPVTYEVGESGGTLSVVMRSVEVEGEMAFNDVQIVGSELTFWWEPGVRVDCTLLRTEAGSFEGSCSDGSGSSGEGRLTMLPPTGAP
jgi:hypothetical protein